MYGMSLLTILGFESVGAAWLSSSAAGSNTASSDRPTARLMRPGLLVVHALESENLLIGSTD